MRARDYQIEAANAGMNFTKKCVDPFLIVVGTGGGKSHIIANMAREFRRLSNKKILVTAPTAEIVLSNFERYEEAGYEANIFCASLKARELDSDVTFASPLSVLPSIDMFDGYGVIMIDEPRNVTPTLRKIIEALAEKNGGSIRVAGFSATPYVTGTGYIYQFDEEGTLMTESYKPFFKKKVCDFGLKYLIENGWNLPPVFIRGTDEHYNTAQLKKSSSKSDEAKVFEGHERLTRSCINDVIEKTRNRHSVIIFAQTHAHANECALSLPAGSSRIITEKTKGRGDVLKAFEAFEFKFLINIAILGVGVNLPCVDALAILRYTKSVDLLVQFVGRGTRKFNGVYNDGTSKEDFIVLDYTDNLVEHFPEGDFYEPKIISRASEKGAATLKVSCESCGGSNEFAPRKNPSNFKIDGAGYLVLLNGERATVVLPNGDTVGIPAHYGRRCNNEELIKGSYTRCEGRWSSKKCTDCGADNDIAAKYCSKCKSEIVNPNSTLNELSQGLTSKFDVRTANVTHLKITLEKTIRGKAYIRLLFLTDGQDKWVSCEVYDVLSNQVKRFNPNACILSLADLVKSIPIDIKIVKYKIKPRSTRAFTLVSAI